MENEINTQPPNQQPSQPGLQPEPMMPAPKPKFRPVILLVVLGIAIAGYFTSAKYLNLWPFEKLMITAPVATPSEVANWQIYQNEQLQFKYPEGWKITSENKPVGWETEGFNLYIENSNGIGHISLSNGIFSDQPILNSLEETVSFIKESLASLKVGLFKEVSVGNGKAFYLFESLGQGPDVPVAYIASKHSVYFLSYTPTEKDATQLDKQQKILLTILSTLKFIAQPEQTINPDASNSVNANQKTYTNTQYGFEFQYPLNWSVMGSNNSVDVYGSSADLASVHIRYYGGLKDLPLNPISHKPYDSFNQYAMDTHFFKEQKLMSLNSGTAESAVLVQDPSIKVALIGGNGHFYEISYQIRYTQTWTQLEQIIQSFKFTN